MAKALQSQGVVEQRGTSLAVQWLRHISNVGGMGSIPGWGSKIAYGCMVWPTKTKTRKDASESEFQDLVYFSPWERGTE